MSSSGLDQNTLLQLLQGFQGGLPSTPSYPTTPQPAQLPGTPQVGNDLLSLITNGGLLPSGQINQGIQKTIPSVTNNPYAGGFQGASNQAGASSGALGGPEVSSALQLLQGSTASLPALQSILQQGFDPQNALRQQTQQTVDNTTGANLANSGLLGSPYGQGVLASNDKNFNIDWQNNLLSRMTNATQAYNQGIGAAGNNAGTAAGVGTTGVGATQGAGQIPYNASTGVTGDQLTQLLNLLKASQSTSQLPLQYLQTAGNLANQASGIGMQNFAGQNTALQNLLHGLAGGAINQGIARPAAPQAPAGGSFQPQTQPFDPNMNPSTGQPYTATADPNTLYGGNTMGGPVPQTSGVDMGGGYAPPQDTGGFYGGTSMGGPLQQGQSFDPNAFHDALGIDTSGLSYDPNLQATQQSGMQDWLGSSPDPWAGGGGW